MALSAGEGISGNMMADILLARKVNLALGGSFVTPWDVAELPDDWISAVLGFTDRLPTMKKGRSEVEKKLEEIRQRHPHYKH